MAAQKRRKARKAPVPPDWPAIEGEYRAGLKSTREIARASTAAGRKISHVAIEKRAKRLGWSRNLTAEVRREINRRLVADAVNKANARPAEQVIALAANEAVQVVKSHRADIGKARRLAGLLMTDLQGIAEGRAALEEELVRMAEESDDEKKHEARRRQLAKAIGLGSNASVLRDLSVAMKNLIMLERQAHGIDEETPPDSIEDRLKRLEQDDA